jgi:N4-gp56 family major capsid protein
MFDLLKVNLQLFAEMNTQTTLLNDAAGRNNLSPEMKTFYDMTLIDEASAQLVHDQFGQKRPIPANGGKTIEFRKFDSLAKATTPITEGVTPNGNKLNVTAITATVSQYGDYIVQSDVLELTSLDNTILEATKILGKQAGLTLDTVVRNILVAGTNVQYCNDKTSRDTLAVGDTLSVKEIQKAVAKLRGMNAPTINGDYVAIIHPYVAYDLMRDPEWIEAHKYAQPENLYTGEIGKVAGVRFVQSSEAKCFGEGKFATLILGEGAYGVTEITGGGLQTIVKQKGSAGTGDPLDQRSSVGWKAMKTAERLVEQYMVRLESFCDGFPTAAAN